MLHFLYVFISFLHVLGALQQRPHIRQAVGTEGVYQEAAVVTNSQICTDIALEIMSEEGAAADAAIAALLCEGITNPQSMGIGGGFLLTYYNSADKTVHVLNAREAAPAEAHSQMFDGLSERDIISGGLPVAVPGEIMGYWELHQRYGKIAWYDLFRPAIDLCQSGVEVTQYTSNMIEKVREDILSSPTLKELLMNPDTRELYKEGELMKRPELGATLELIARHGPKVLYNGTLTEEFVGDIKDNGGIITVDDMRSYKATWMTPVSEQIGQYTIYSTPPPGSGQLLLLILDIMAHKLCRYDANFWLLLVETWKYAYGVRGRLSGPVNGSPKRNDYRTLDAEAKSILRKLRHFENTSMNLEDYASEQAAAAPDHGTSHLCFRGPNGDAIAVTSTINLSFGALFVSESTGIIPNNQMIDFAIPNTYPINKLTKSNIIRPHVQPMSSMVPTIVLDAATKQLRLVIGSAGGFKIITSATYVILAHIYMNMCLRDAIGAKRLHHQLEPMLVEYEEGFPADVLHRLREAGHQLVQLDNATRIDSSASMAMHSCVNAIAMNADQTIHAVGDCRRRAVAGGF